MAFNQCLHLCLYLATVAIISASVADPLVGVKQRLRPLEKKLKDHPIYDELRTVSDLTVFMQHHVYGVLDFMSLLKYLQNTFAPSAFPWKPIGDPSIRRFINEIVAEEESDYANPEHEGYSSHFEMYCRSMEELNVSASSAMVFAHSLTDLASFDDTLSASTVPTAAKAFLNSTFATLKEGKAHVVAASFAFGRENLIPMMFTEFLSRMQISRRDAPTFFYYLDRHIEVDGDNHGPLSMQMLREICGDDEQKWRDVEEGAVFAIENRIAFWDAVLRNIKHSREYAAGNTLSPKELDAASVQCSLQPSDESVC